MSKPIFMTPDFMEVCLKEFGNILSGSKMLDGKVTFTKTFTSSNEKKAVVWYTPEAWMKMFLLLMNFDKEVAWHGVVSKKDSDDKVNNYLISDILVYPQEVSGATVDMDTEKYAKWLMENDDDERFSHLYAQGHSHVNMAVNPSGVDMNHQEMILNQLDKDGFYIFMIYNKKLEHNFHIYDLKDNIFFDTQDVVTKIVGGTSSMEKFLSDAKSVVKEKSYYSETYYGSSSAYGGSWKGYNKSTPYSSGSYSSAASGTSKNGSSTGTSSSSNSKPVTKDFNDWKFPKNYTLDDPDYYSGEN